MTIIKKLTAESAAMLLQTVANLRVYILYLAYCSGDQSKNELFWLNLTQSPLRPQCIANWWRCSQNVFVFCLFVCLWLQWDELSVLLTALITSLFGHCLHWKSSINPLHTNLSALNSSNTKQRGREQSWNTVKTGHTFIWWPETWLYRDDNATPHSICQ